MTVNATMFLLQLEYSLDLTKEGSQHKGGHHHSYYGNDDGGYVKNITEMLIQNISVRAALDVLWKTKMFGLEMPVDTTTRAQCKDTFKLLVIFSLLPPSPCTG